MFIVVLFFCRILPMYIKNTYFQKYVLSKIRTFKNYALFKLRVFFKNFGFSKVRTFQITCFFKKT